MPSPVLHLSNPQRAEHALCGLPLAIDEPRITEAVLSTKLSIEAAGSEGPGQACRGCFVRLLSAALPRYGAQLVTAFAAEPSALLWTGAALRERREAAGLTRADVARLAKLTEATIRNVETRSLKVSTRVLHRLMSVAQLTPTRSK